MTTKSKAYIIGDDEHGLTIVVTNPVLVVHYPPEFLEKDPRNRMRALGSKKTMAAIVQDLMPALGHPVAEDGGVAPEALAERIASDKPLHDVDFCIAFDIDPQQINTRGRLTSPKQQILSYLEMHMGKAPDTTDNEGASAQQFDIDGLRSDNLVREHH